MNKNVATLYGINVLIVTYKEILLKHKIITH